MTSPLPHAFPVLPNASSVLRVCHVHCRKLTQQLECLLANRSGSKLHVEAAVAGLAGPGSSSSSWRLQACRRAAMALRLHSVLLPQLQVRFDCFV
jgi:hypothetical protein